MLRRSASTVSSFLTAKTISLSLNSTRLTLRASTTTTYAPKNVGISISVSGHQKLYEQSINDPTEFWRNRIGLLNWMRQPDEIVAGDFTHGDIRWFAGGRLNVSENCLDRHVRQTPDKVAIIWEGDEIGITRKITYSELLREVCKIANALKSVGIKKGDPVCIYLPMIPEAAMTMLACARIGAVHTVVFAGFSPQALRERIEDTKSKVLITADEAVRGGKAIPLKQLADQALEGLNQVHTVFVHQRTGSAVTNMNPGRDVFLRSATENERPFCPAEPMDSEDPLFILYTSGSTGKPKGIVHTTGGYLLYTTLTHKYIFNIQPNDIYACVADIGWITGHSYVVYGPLSNGITTVMFESLPTYPNASRYWELIERCKVNSFYTAPTAIRALMKFGDEYVHKHDLSSLRVLGSVGEPINPEAWKWYYKVVGKERCTIVDTFWQTETGGIICAPVPGISPMKPGAAMDPFYGIQPIVLDPHTGTPAERDEKGNRSGVLCIAKPWPGIARTILGSHSRFISNYLSAYPGYYFTGDGCVIDAEGHIWITGRVDDVITKAGHRIGTAEIESALVSYEHCNEAAVVSIPHDIKGQSIVAFCTLKDNAEIKTTAKELKAHVRQEIGAIASPDYVIITTHLPKTRSGKIMRKMLRKLANKEEDIGDITTLADSSVIETLRAQVAEVINE